MKKVLVTILMVVSLTSCEIQRANGPKVSDGSLKNEMTDLVMFGTVEPMRALRVILTEGFEKSGRIGTFTHPSFLRWDFVATWLEGGSGKHWSCEASAQRFLDNLRPRRWNGSRLLQKHLIPDNSGAPS